MSKTGIQDRQIHLNQHGKDPGGDPFRSWHLSPDMATDPTENADLTLLGKSDARFPTSPNTIRVKHHTKLTHSWSGNPLHLTCVSSCSSVPFYSRTLITRGSVFGEHSNPHQPLRFKPPDQGVPQLLAQVRVAPQLRPRHRPWPGSTRTRWPMSCARPTTTCPTRPRLRLPHPRGPQAQQGEEGLLQGRAGGVGAPPAGAVRRSAVGFRNEGPASSL